MGKIKRFVGKMLFMELELNFSREISSCRMLKICNYKEQINVFFFKVQNKEDK